MEVPKSSKKSAEMWTEFIEWLHQQQIETTLYFVQSMQCKYEISVTKRHVNKTENSITECYEVADDSYSLQHCRVIDEEINEEWTKVIAEMKFNGTMITHSKIVGVTCDINLIMFNRSMNV